MVAGLSALFARRTAAVLAATSAGLHAAMLGHAGSVAAAVLFAAMIGACLYCARELWLRGTSRDWCLVAVMSLGMVAVHLPVSASHHVAHSAVSAVAPQSVIMTLATTFAMAEVVIAVAVLCYRTRGNAGGLSAVPAARDNRR